MTTTDVSTPLYTVSILWPFLGMMMLDTTDLHSLQHRSCVEDIGILVVDKDNLINYQLVISYRLLIRILTNQPTVDKTIVLSDDQPTVNRGESVDDS